jgi:small subunit ribosomal protein S3
MGQKVNPNGFRLGFNKNWSAHWFAGKNYAAYLEQDAIARTTVMKRYPRAGIALIEVFRRQGEVVVTIHTAKPGIIIGRGGAGSTELRANLEKQLFKHILPKERPNLRLNIVEVKSPELSARLVAETIAGQLERRIAPKRAMRQAIERTMERRAKGIKVRIAGRLNGAEIARSENSSNGSIPLQTMRSDLSYAQAEAKTTYGVIGIKVWIYLGQQDEMPEDTAEQPSRTRSR